MPRAGELTFFDAVGEAGRSFAVNKPFSEDSCGAELMQVGSILSLLPPPPGKVLECGCGTGWLCCFLQKRGYQVVGTDVSVQAIELARSHPVFCGLEPPRFLVADSEQLPFEAEFDVVVFYDSLHHAVDELAALRCAYRALKPGGICVTSEPGLGHQSRSQDVIQRYDVTEKDMPPRHVRKLGRLVGFRRSKVYPRADHLGRLLFTTKWPALGRFGRLLGIWPFRYLASMFLMMFVKRYFGITVLFKGPADQAG
jgi:ubiquinone/menaquinone biosynthesis C-methylase UbiE